MKKSPNILWIATLVLGWSFDFLFWKQSFGINFAIFSILCLAVGIFILWRAKLYPARDTLWLILPILFFITVTFVRTEPMTVFLGIFFAIFLMGFFAISFLGGRWYKYSLTDYLVGFFNLGESMLIQPLKFKSEISHEEREAGQSNSKVNLWPIVRGLLIALPIIAIFASLLASADAIFSEELNSIIKLFFNLDILPEYIFRFFYILVIGYVLAGTFLHPGSKSRDEKLLGEDKPGISPFLGFTETTIVLGSVTILFAVFVVIQFRYFFGGQVNINIVGFTYSEYARRGFGELLAVAFFSLLLILGLGVVAQRENDKERRIYSGLSAGIVVLVMIMLVSAYQRLRLYEIAYGFSRLRTYTHVVLIWIGLLLGVVVILEIFHRERAFVTAALITSLGFAASLGLMNVDGFIVQQNVNRAVQGKGLDVPYLVSLSNDSVPVLVHEFQSTALPGLTRDAVGAVLFCQLHSNSVHPAKDWRSFTLSGWQAETAMNGVKERLDRYRSIDDQWPLQILTPGNVSYNCYASGVD